MNGGVGKGLRRRTYIDQIGVSLKGRVKIHRINKLRACEEMKRATEVKGRKLFVRSAADGGPWSVTIPALLCLYTM